MGSSLPGLALAVAMTARKVYVNKPYNNAQKAKEAIVKSKDLSKKNGSLRSAK